MGGWYFCAFAVSTYDGAEISTQKGHKSDALALLATMVLVLRTLLKHENHFVNQSVRFQVQLEADGYFSAREVFAFATTASRASWYQLAIFESDFTNPTSKTIVGLRQNPIFST